MTTTPSLSAPSQAPLHSGFGAETNAAEVIRGADLSGKNAIVTGGYAGIGRETTRVLAEAGASVLVPARDVKKAQANLRGIPGVEIAPLDLLDSASIDAFASSYLASGKPLHLLVNNAGVMALPLTRDARGYEVQFATNHLGHFQLTARLWPALARAQGARVVQVSSRGHRYSGIDFDDIHYARRDYEKMHAYGQSKTANILFAQALDRRGAPHGVRAFSLHPGAILTTDLARHLGPDDLKRWHIEKKADGTLAPASDCPFTFKDVPQGAATTVWCAVSPQLEGMGGLYCEDCDVSPLAQEQKSGDLSLTGLHPWAADPQSAERLWTVSEELTGVPFPI
ncbi:MAG: oxidoreductase [Verrucomicrobium sp.]|nr:oxidoreductase [Verrucomicrobium sp.]